MTLVKKLREQRELKSLVCEVTSAAFQLSHIVHDAITLLGLHILVLFMYEDLHK